MSDPAVGQLVDGRYEIEAVIGRGGMGTVFRARHVFTNVRVALKMMSDTLDGAAGQRFLAEARAASTIGHPAIVVVSDANRTPEGRLYLVMELLAGKPLRLAMTGALAGDQVRRIGLEMLDALAAAHARGVVHRDLKPENVFLVAPTGAVKILDFGIAKVIGAGTTSHGHVLGTLEYMAPEQLYDSADVDGRADLWAIGVILYEMIAGLRPLGGTTREERFHALASDEPMPIGEVVPVTADVAAFFAQALSRDLIRRFQTAQQMTAALRHITLAPAAGQAGIGDGGQTLGTGAVWVPRSSGPGQAQSPGPTLGTGHAWVQPASVPPQGAPGPTPAWLEPASAPPADRAGDLGLAPTQRAPASLASGQHAPKARRRGFLVVAVAIVAIAGATTIGVIAGASDPVAGARNLTGIDGAAPLPASAPEPSLESCTSLCSKLAGCNLALQSCVLDCAANRPYQRCLASASTCDQRAACHWGRICGRPIQSGEGSCMFGLTCVGQNAMLDTKVQCSNCYDLLSKAAATALAQFTICNAGITELALTLGGSAREATVTKAWNEKCQRFSYACAGYKAP